MIPDNLQTLVEIGVRLFDDPSFFHKISLYFQRNKRGSFHVNDGCSILRGAVINRRTCVSTPMSIVEMAAAKHCSACCNADILGSNKELLHGMHWLESALTECDTLLAGPVTVRTVGTVIDRLETVRHKCSDDTKFPGLSKARETFRKQIAANMATITQHISSLTPMFIPWAALQLGGPDKGRNNPHHIKHDAQNITLFGAGTVRPARISNNKIDDIHDAWSCARLQSREAADKAALLDAQTSKLQNIKQLCFDLAPSSVAVRCDETVTKTWEQELVQRLTETILPEWEKSYNDLTQLLEPRLVGLRGEGRSLETFAILASFPHSARKLGKDQMVTLVPEIVALWLKTFEGNWEPDQVVVLAAVSPDLLDTITALWEPGDDESPYHEFADVARAAQTL